MSNVAALAAVQSADAPLKAEEQLAALLDLHSAGLEITGARIVGVGSRASADLYLSDGSSLFFESIKDIANPKTLAIEVRASTAARPNLKAPQALDALSLIRAIAEHHEGVTLDHLSREQGVTFLQSASTIKLDMNDQAARWRAFSHLEQIEPYSKARADASSVARASVVLVHTDGTRFVRCGWFRSFARTEDPGASPQQVAQRMERVGWKRRGATGRIKATRPGHDGSLVWTFYMVPAGWEDDPEGAS
jgi:hypothetical protein